MGRIKKNEYSPKLRALLIVLANNLNRERERQGMSQQTLAVAAGITASTISEIESLRATNVELATVVTLAIGLKIEPIDLLRKREVTK